MAVSLLSSINVWSDQGLLKTCLRKRVWWIWIFISYIGNNCYDQGRLKKIEVAYHKAQEEIRRLKEELEEAQRLLSAAETKTLSHVPQSLLRIVFYVLKQ